MVASGVFDLPVAPLAGRTLVLALGNPLRGDDGIGAAVLAELARYALPTSIDLLDGGTPGFETVLLLANCQHALIIDAADLGLAPGQWRRFTLAEACLLSHDLTLRGTLHYAGLAEALTLGEALGQLPPQLTIYGIQPADIGWEIGLSAPVQTAIAPVAQAIYEELTHAQNSSG